jgi:restriction endonuclease S subunit
LGADGTKVLKPSDKLLPQFAYYALHHLDIPSAGYNRHFKYLKEMKVSYPDDLEEQKRIAAILEEADHARRTRRFTQSVSDTFLQAVFVEMFGDPVTNPMGWEWTLVDNIKAKKKYSCVGGPFGSNLTTAHYVNSPGIPVIRGTNINDSASTFRDYDFVYVTEEKADSLVQNTAYPGDLIFTQRGTLGQIGYIPINSEYDRYIVSQSQMKLTPNLNMVESMYLYGYFMTQFAQDEIQRRALVTGVPHINLGILKEFPVMLPPITQQRAYIEVVTDHEKVTTQQHESARQAEHLFQTLLHRAFRGEL